MKVGFRFWTVPWQSEKFVYVTITEHSLHGINTSRQMAESVTHVSGTFCHLSLRSLNQSYLISNDYRVSHFGAGSRTNGIKWLDGRFKPPRNQLSAYSK
jgi:hypothetical protein